MDKKDSKMGIFAPKKRDFQPFGMITIATIYSNNTRPGLNMKRITAKIRISVASAFTNAAIPPQTPAKRLSITLLRKGLELSKEILLNFPVFADQTRSIPAPIKAIGQTIENTEEKNDCMAFHQNEPKNRSVSFTMPKKMRTAPIIMPT